MGIPVLVLAQSGSGKSASLRNLDMDRTLLINVANKPLPFRNKWEKFDKETKKGTIVFEDNLKVIRKIIEAVPNIEGKNIVVIDDFQYAMSNQFFSKIDEKGLKY